MGTETGKADTFVIVYQFGKVASTAVVSTLNRVEGVEAVQSHFLGREALHQTVDNMLSPSMGAYFLRHQLGQFQLNLQYTRRMLAIMSGASDERLVVLSICREPMTWLRSAITQDAEAYLPVFRALAAEAGVANGDDGAAIRMGLPELLNRFSRVIEASDGLDAILAGLRAGRWRLSDHFPPATQPGQALLFQVLLRPFQWYRAHFSKALDLSLDELSYSHVGFWYCRRELADYLVLRYEDLDRLFEPACAHAGLADVGPLDRANESRKKPHDADIRAGFDAADLGPLARQFAASFYARFFGYTGAQETGT